jgi:hypothetical protein
MLCPHEYDVREVPAIFLLHTVKSRCKVRCSGVLGNRLCDCNYDLREARLVDLVCDVSYVVQSIGRGLCSKDGLDIGRQAAISQ